MMKALAKMVATETEMRGQSWDRRESLQNLMMDKF